MAKVQLDMIEESVNPESTEEIQRAEEFNDFLNYKKIGMQVIQEIGPAGGNALVEFIGSRDDLEEMICRYFNEDGLQPIEVEPTNCMKAQLDHLISQIKD